MVGGGQNEHEDPVEFLSSILAAVPSFITRIDSDYRIRYINRLLPPLDMSQVVGVNVFDFIAEEYHDIARTCFEQVMATGERSSYESVALGANGDQATYVNYVTAILKEGQTNGLCIVGVDVSEERARELALRESESRLQLAVASTRLGLWHWNIQTDSIDWNDRMYEICGVDAPLDVESFASELVHPDDRQLVTEAAEKMMTSREVVQNASRLIVDGDVRWILSSGQASFDDEGNVLALTGGLLDITEQRRTEERLHQVEKMEAIGQLTAGVAHNFNNMLMALLPTLELLGQEVKGKPKELVDDAIAVSNRAAEMVRKLMDLAGRRSSPRHGPVSLNQVADEAVRICAGTFERHIRLTVDQRDDATVLGDANELTQVVVNLLLNARDALVGAATESAEVEVIVALAPDSVVVPSTIPGHGGFAMLQVRDNGPGFSPSIRARLFEPFFTTKELVGTGMGLATCAAIVERHGGWMTANSTSGQGSEFSTYLPLTDAVVAEAPLVGALEKPLARSARVLLIDDDDAVRKVLERTFAHLDLEATCIGSLAEALALLEETTAFDVVLLDRSMPEGPGGRALPTLRERLPDAKILFFTGETVPESELASVDGLVTKPLSVAKLLEAIRRSAS